MNEQLILDIERHVRSHGPLQVIACMRLLFEMYEFPPKGELPEMVAIWEATVLPGMIKMLREAEEECERLYHIGNPRNN